MKYNNLILKRKRSIFSVKLTLTILFFNLNSINAQNIHVSKRLETGIYSSNLIWGVGNLLLTNYGTSATRNFQINGLDNHHISVNNHNLKKASDITFWSCAALSAMLAINSDKNLNWNFANLLVENTLITANLTQTVKVLVGRERPSKWNSNDDYYSFFSGHSSLTASAAATSLYYAYHVPNAPKHAKIIGWSAAGLSLITGILRIESGKHYPSDVLIGWTVGTGVALLNGYIHRPR